jgi:hypothetical protein
MEDLFGDEGSSEQEELDGCQMVSEVVTGRWWCSLDELIQLDIHPALKRKREFDSGGLDSGGRVVDGLLYLANLRRFTLVSRAKI